MSARSPSQPDHSTPAGRLDEGVLGTVFGYQLAQATVLSDQIFQRRVAGPLGLRKVEFTVLALVARNEGLTATQLASALAFTAPNTAAWIERLVGRGLVTREQHTQDRRALHIRSTAAGLEVLDRAVQAISEGEREALQPLSPGERLILMELLHKAARCRLPGK